MVYIRVVDDAMQFTKWTNRYHPLFLFIHYTGKHTILHTRISLWQTTEPIQTLSGHKMVQDVTGPGTDTDPNK